VPPYAAKRHTLVQARHCPTPVVWPTMAFHSKGYRGIPSTAQTPIQWRCVQLPIAGTLNGLEVDVLQEWMRTKGVQRRSIGSPAVYEEGGPVERLEVACIAMASSKKRMQGCTLTMIIELGELCCGSYRQMEFSRLAVVVGVLWPYQRICRK